MVELGITLLLSAIARISPHGLPKQLHYLQKLPGIIQRLCFRQLPYRP